MPCFHIPPSKEPDTISSQNPLPSNAGRMTFGNRHQANDGGVLSIHRTIRHSWGNKVRGEERQYQICISFNVISLDIVQVGSEVHLFAIQPQFASQAVPMDIDGTLGDIQDLGNFFAGFPFLDQLGNLDFPAGEIHTF